VRRDRDSRLRVSDIRGGGTNVLDAARQAHAHAVRETLHASRSRRARDPPPRALRVKQAWVGARRRRRRARTVDSGVCVWVECMALVVLDARRQWGTERSSPGGRSGPDTRRAAFE
jgi:hypothetical protein